MKIIVTGGAGFIASHITDAYIAAGHRVAVIDNLSKGSRRNVNPKATFYKADVTDLARMETIFAKERPEAVNHHAAIAEVTLSVRDPIPTLTANVLGTANVLLAFGHHGKGGAKRKFIFASTGGAMYGDPKRIPVDERAPVDLLSPYGLSKKLAEDTILFYEKQFGFEYFIFRYANVFGPRQNPRGEAGIVAIFGELMRNGQRPVIFGDGTKARDYVYVSDVARANVAALKKGRNTIVNIGHGIPITDQEMFEAIAHEAGYTGAPRYAPQRPGEIYRSALDAKKASRLLGWRPRVKLEEGIREALRKR